MGWHKGMLLAFDLETTGIDVETDRIVTGCASLINGTTGEANTHTLLANPGIEIPDAATQVHGITTEYAAEHGEDPAHVVAVLASAIMGQVFDGVPVVGYNLAYDLTLLDRESRRHGLEPFGEQLTAARGVVIDAFVLDKHLDRYRKGSRKLADVCAHYDVRIDGAHDASHDALAAARVAYRIAQRNPHIADMPLHELHELQARAKAEQAQSFRAYLQKQGKPHDDVRDEWPVIPYERQEAQA
ncbi:3'-5' exonuclease [Nonomuraea indica]|uniref:3'-5' exonuclease n=1 Tax=Nonomuraea indica TaxID=1581193 RepID=UPI000C7E6CD7|nr:3'-5' exonuclease [Nonomuraea indica]